MDFPISESAPLTEKFTSRRVFAPNGAESSCEPAGTDGASGLLRFTPEKPGMYIVGVQSPTKILSMSADDFNHYLVSDGLPHIYEERHKEGSLRKNAIERYSKSPKCLIRVGEGVGDPTKVIGQTLEIVPLKDPFAILPGGSLSVRVLFRGKPLADANLGWDVPGDGPRFSGTVRTNQSGEATVPITQSGLMTIRLTHMTRPKEADFEWESFWSSLTWHVPVK